MTTNETKSPATINATMDIAKLMMALLVVGIHTEPFGFNVWMDRGFGIITRLCVPFFFTASSYFYWVKKGTKPVIRYILRLALLYLIWTIIYLPLDIHKLGTWSFMECVDIFLWSGYRHMWYISCSIIGFLIVYLLSRRFNAKTVLAISFVFLFIGCCKSTWLPLIRQMSNLHLYDFLGSRNGLFYAFPYMALGKYIAEYKSQTKRRIIYAKLCASMLLLILESFIFVVKYQTNSTILWLSVFPATFYLFQLLLTYNISIKKEVSVRARNVSTLIYFLHPYFILAFAGVLSNIPLFIVVSACSLVASYIIVRVSKVKNLGFLKYLY